MKHACKQCQKRLGAVDLVLGPCEGCQHFFCIKHKQEHIHSCSAFHEKRRSKEKEELMKRLQKEATRDQKVQAI
jgi:hypothetical protein